MQLSVVTIELSNVEGGTIRRLQRYIRDGMNRESLRCWKAVAKVKSFGLFIRGSPLNTSELVKSNR